MSQKLTILFDLDGTLVNTAPDLMRAHNFVMKKYGYDERELEDIGVNIVIYANHMLRAAYPAMQNAAESILKHQRSFELENKISSVKKVINLIK